MRQARRYLLVVLGIAAGSALLGRAGAAHEGHRHTALGVLTAIEAAGLELETTNGTVESFLLTQKTAFLRGDAVVSRDNVAVGERAVVTYEETDAGKTALEVELAAAPAEEAGNGAATADPELQVVEARYVCMINDALFEREQIPVEVQGRTYFGCCPMCKERLAADATARTATDPATGEPVDKATALIAATPDGRVLYFASAETLAQYVAAQ